MKDLQTIRGSEMLDRFVDGPDPNHVEADLTKALRVVDRILASSDRKIRDRNFLLENFLEYGIPKVKSTIFDPWRLYMNPSGFGAFQFPTEFVDFIGYAASLNIETAIEIGCFCGGSSYFLGAVLQRINPAFSLTVVDIEDNLMGFDAFSRRLRIDKAIPKTSEDFAGDHFDLVFIDGDHSYAGVMRDHLHVGQHATKVLAFHDIHGHEFDNLDGGTVRAWGNVKESLRMSHEILEFAHSVERSLGIGVAVNRETANSI